MENNYKYYKFIRTCLDECERIYEKIKMDPNETTDDEDHYLDHFDMQLADALLRDFDGNNSSKNELRRVCNIVLSALD